ncbi:AAA family ATPase [Candidatus Dependentiae bacterium]|nr:AAA family ATPase [Candidatus Dependentiae bacterium]
MYILEGNIGVGKSTFIQKIKQYLPELEVLTEPVDNWTNQIFGQSLLENFYKDTSRWAYTLENLAMIQRTKDHIEIQKNKNPKIVVERSIYSGHYCFARNSFENGHLAKIEWNIYQKWADFLIKNCQTPSGFLYLKANPEVCFERIKKRNRMSEKKLTLAYVKQIDQWHEKFLVKKEEIHKNLKNIPVLQIDCNTDFENNPKILKKHLEQINNFINDTILDTKAILEKTAFFEQNL